MDVLSQFGRSFNSDDPKLKRIVHFRVDPRPSIFVLVHDTSPKAGIHGPKPVDSGPDQDQTNFRNQGPVQTRTEKMLEIPDQLGPGPHLWKIGPTPDRTKAKKNYDNWDRTMTKKNIQISDRIRPGPTKFWKSRTDSDRSVPGPVGPWIPAPKDFSRNHTV